jgi:hypothetical protein
VGIDGTEVGAGITGGKLGLGSREQATRLAF